MNSPCPVVKLSILLAKAVFICAVVLYVLKSTPIVDPDKVIGAVTEMLSCLAASSVVRAAVSVYADRSIPTALPDNVTGAVTEIVSCFPTTSKVPEVKTRACPLTKESSLVAKAVFIWAVVL